MKKNKKYLIVSIIILVLILLSDFLIHLVINKSYESKIDDKKIVHTLPVVYTIMDEENTPSNVTSTEATSKYENNILYSTVGYVELEEQNNYYISKLNNMNKILGEKIASFGFAYNDITGTTIDDASFDSNKNIKIPKKYYDKFKAGDKEPIKMQVVVLLNKKDLDNVKIDIKNYNNKTKTVKVNGNNVSTAFSIMNPNKGKIYSKNDILIYINGSNQSVFKDKYTWDPNSGNIQLNIDPILIDNITVKIKKKSLLEKIISLKNIFAETATYENMASSGELESEPSLNTGDDMTISGINTWYFWPSCQTEENTCSYPTDVINAYKNGDKYLYSKCDNGNCTLSESLYEDFIVKFEGEYKSDNKSLKFKNAIYASLFCNDHSNDASSTNVNGSFNLHVIKIDTDAKYVIVKLIGASQAWQGGQTPAGVLKFTWSTPAQGSIAVRKVLYGKNNTEILGERFRATLYKGEGCRSGSAISSRLILSGDQVSWKNLATNEKYSLKETTCDTNKYKCDTTCRNIDLDEEDCSGNTCMDTTLVKNPIKNYQKYYCLKVKKIEKDTSYTLAGASFDLWNKELDDCEGNSCKTDCKNVNGKLVCENRYFTRNVVTASNGQAVFTYLPYSSYWLRETKDSDVVSLTSSRDNQQHFYLNASAAKLINTSDLKLMEMTTDKTTGNVSYACPSNTSPEVVENTPLGYCTKVKKVDLLTDKALEGAEFTAYLSETGKAVATATTDKNGIATFYFDNTYNNGRYYIKETKAPDGYQINTKGKYVQIDQASTNGKCDNITSPLGVFENQKIVLNWYKATESKTTLASGAVFEVSKNGVKLHHKQTKETYMSRKCYVYSTDENDPTDFVSDGDGVCYIGLPSGSYSVTEVKTLDSHTYGEKKVLILKTSTNFTEENNTFVNYPTSFEFTKNASFGNDENTKVTIDGKEISLSDLTKKELKNFKFNIYKGDTKLEFVLVDGVYEYADNTIEQFSGDRITDLQLNDNNKIIVHHLPVGTYTIKEKNTCDENSCECSGYYYPSYTSDNTSEYKFTINRCSNSSAEYCATHVSATSSLTNYPTEIEFTKKDLYSNVDGNDKVTFEGDDEITAFDEIGFKLKQGQTDITNHLIKVSDGNYRYVKDDLPVSSQLSEIYTKNGTFTITHLCRNTSYTISEDSVPENSIFDVVDKDGNRPSVTFKIDETKPSTKQKAEIVDEPTRVIIEKKDITTNETIQEEENTNKKNSSIFEVYRCKSDKVCGDTFNIDDITKITFKELKGTQTDEKRYAYTIDQSDKSNVSELVLTKGKIILRYLPAGFRYYIKEKNAPDGYYKLDDNKVNSFIQETSNLDIKINIGNTPTSITFKKEDIFNYYNSSDQSKINENVKLFDTMRFKLHDKDGNTLKLKCVTKDGKGYNDQTKMCESGVYRYLTYSDTENNISELNTVNGTFTITHLYNNQKYYIEEVKSDDEGNFILPSNKKYKNLPFNNNGHPVVTYNVPETKPVSDDDNSITQLIKNDSTRVVFEKRDSKTNELINDDLTSSNSTKTTFRVYMCDKSVSKCTIDNGTLVYFTDREYVDDNDIDANNRKVKAYKYSKLNSSTNAITDLHTDQGTLIIRYLPSNYKYVIYETVAPSGYYNPTQINGQIEFTVEGTTVSEDKDYEDITEVIQNTPTELIFNKEDLYNYYSSEDITGSNNLTKLFDTMKFKLYNEKGEVLALKCTTVNGKGYNDKTKTCESGEYRYLPVDSKENIMTELNTINGTFKVTHLYRNKKYYIEEIKSDDEGIFILPNYMTFDNLPFDNNGHPVVQYVLPEKKPDSYESITEVIENIPTRVRLEKRDSKYGYLIDDETTTFNVYACEKSVDKCTKENGKLIYFTERATIKGDKEDDSIEVYKYSKTNTKAISDLHPYHGVLVLRYLPSKYKYVLVETKSPKGYVLPNNENRKTEFSVKSETSVVEGIDVPNKATSLLIKKYSDDGKLLPGAEFKIYEGTTCDANVSAMNQPKTLLKLNTIRDGVYENRPTKDTDSVVTCTDREGAKCSDISTTASTKLTYNDYIKSWANFDNSIDDENNKIELQEGEALIQYLDYNKCYIIEEVKAPKGYSLPKNEEDRYTMITIDEDPSIKTTKKELINRPTTFTFYKYDEYNNLLDGAEFKLQKLDDNKKYQDIAVTKEETENGVYYKADESSDNKIITTVNGSATVYYLEEGQYRIVEVTPAPGKELSKNPNIATFFVDNSGNVYGNSIIVNKSKTEKIEVKSSASAELVVSIQTGQKVIRYGLVIATIVSVIIALMIMLRMYKKQSE